MISVDVTISGTEEAQRRLSGLHDAIRFRLRPTLAQLGQEVADMGASFAPHKSGTLAGEIKARQRESGSSITETIRPGGKAFYGQWQETGLDTMRKPARRRGITGVRTRVTKTGTVLVTARHGLMRRAAGWSEHPFHLPAHPFMRPAVEALRGRIEQQIKAAVDAAVERG